MDNFLAGKHRPQGGLPKRPLLRFAANLIVHRISRYASLFVFCAPCIWAFLNSLFLPVVLQHPAKQAFLVVFRLLPYLDMDLKSRKLTNTKGRKQRLLDGAMKRRIHGPQN
jgi:hypothetical protein